MVVMGYGYSLEADVIVYLTSWLSFEVEISKLVSLTKHNMYTYLQL